MKYLIISLCFIFSISASAQKFSVEPNVGINIMPFPETGTGTIHKVAFNGGLDAKYEIIKNLTINVGLGISDRRLQYHYSDTISILEQYRGFMEQAGIDVDEIDSTLQANGLYLNQFDKTYGVASLAHFEVPISVTYKWKSIRFNAGGYLSFRINSTKTEEVTSDVPLLQTVDLNQIDTSGTLSFFFPAPHSVSSSIVSNEENLDNFIYGIRLGIGYQYDSQLSFNASYNLDLNTYALDQGNEITNNKYFFRIGMAYNIYSLKMNQKVTKPKFE